jgi:hypothetical protein
MYIRKREESGKEDINLGKTRWDVDKIKYVNVKWGPCCPKRRDHDKEICNGVRRKLWPEIGSEV